jgi:exopolysaccharide biosynthesis polyprenyl glycosylphosphotransferase
MRVLIGFRIHTELHQGVLFISTSFGTMVGLLAWFICTLVLISRNYQLYNPFRLTSVLHEQRLTVQACFTSGLLLTGAIYLFHASGISRILVMTTICATTGMLCVRRVVYRTLMYRRFEKGLETRNILIVGTGRVGQALRHHLDSIRHLGYTFKGFVSVPGVDTENSSNSGEVIGSLENVYDIARKYFIDEVFFATPCERGVIKRMVEQARNAGVDIRVVPDLYDGLAWNSPIEYVGQFPTIPLHRGEVPEISLFLKRGMDILLSSLIILLASPIFLALAIIIKLDSPGPILYISDRIGKKGRVFRCFKFRTMILNADVLKAQIQHMNERDGVLFKVTDDPRVTHLGRFLRKYSLDEIPQFFNVLIGDMSMVGPRPPIASEVKQYDLTHLRRLDVTPGITGLWQVEARQDPSFDSYISLDTAYIENWSIWLDLKILIRTIGVVLDGTGS